MMIGLRIKRSGMTRKWKYILALAIGLGVSGCDRPNESLEAFRNRWSNAASQKEAKGLYHMLDSASKRKIRQDLQIMQGLDSVSQRLILDRLGDKSIKNLTQLSTDRYFALLWQQSTRGKIPTIQVEAEGPQSAYMIMSIKQGWGASATSRKREPR